MNSSNFVGQDHIRQNLSRQLEDKRLNHAYLFIGPRGQGKTTLARILSGAVLCENFTSSGHSSEQNPCGTCLSCQKFAKGIHPDFTCIGDRDNKIKIEQIRKIKNSISYRPSEASKKVYLIRNAENLTRESANSMLKMLEEPPEYAIFILTASSSESMLPTILSRCEVYKFQPVKEEEVKTILRTETDYPQDKLDLAVAFSGGYIGRARSVLEDDYYQEMVDYTHKFCKELPKANIMDLLQWAELINSYEQEEFLELISTLLRDKFVYSLSKDTRLLFYKQGMDNEDLLDSEKIYQILEILESSKAQLSTNVNRLLTLETMLFEMKEVVFSGKVSSSRSEI